MSSSDMSRRSVLTAAATAPLAAFPLAGEATQSPVMALFGQWQAIHYSDHSLTDEEWDQECDRASEIVKEMMSLPIANAGDLAAKMIAHTNNFDFGSSGPDAERFQQQVRAFVEGVA